MFLLLFCQIKNKAESKKFALIFVNVKLTSPTELIKNALCLPQEVKCQRNGTNVYLELTFCQAMTAKRIEI